MLDRRLEYSHAEKTSVFVSTLLGYGMDFYNILIISFLIGAIQKSLNLSLTDAGIITTTTLIGSVFGGIFFGWLGDKVGRKNSLLLTLGLFSLGAIASAFAWDFGSLLVCRAIAGIGLGGEWGAGMVLFNEVWKKERRGLGSSIIQASATLGIAMASVVSVWALSNFSPDWGWRVALLTGGAPILLMVYVRFWMPESKIWLEYERLRSSGELPSTKAAARNPLIEIFRGSSLIRTLLGMLVVSGYMFAFYSVTVFMPALMRAEGASQETIRTATLLFSLASALSFLIFGWLSDVVGRKIAVLIPTAIGIVGFAGIYLFGSIPFAGSLIWPLLGWYLLWGIGQSSSGLFGPWFSELYPVELRSSAVSTIYMVGRGIGSVAPYIVPVLAAQNGTGLLRSIMIGSIATLVGGLAAMLLPEVAGRTFDVLESKDVALKQGRRLDG